MGGGLVPEEGGQLEKEPVWGRWCPPAPQIRPRSDISVWNRSLPPKGPLCPPRDPSALPGTPLPWKKILCRWD